MLSLNRIQNTNIILLVITVDLMFKFYTYYIINMAINVDNKMATL